MTDDVAKKAPARSVVRQPGARATAAVDALLDELGLSAPEDIDVALIAAHLRAVTVVRELANEEGHLVRSGKRGIITVGAAAHATRHWRFVLAHELGHFLLHDAHDDFVRCTADAPRGQRRAIETEANDFASVLLVPRRMLREPPAAPALADVVRLANRFDVEVSMMAIRVVQLTAAARAVVHVTRGVVDWWTTSASFEGSFVWKREVDPRTQVAALLRGEHVDAVDDAWPYAPRGSREEAVRTHGDSAVAWLAHDPA